MSILLGQDVYLSRWVAQKAGHARDDFGPSVAIGKCDADGHVLGAFVFHEYCPQYRSIQMSFAGSNGWLTRGFLRFAWAYPFLQLGVNRVYGCVAARNPVAQQTAQRMGATFEARLKEGLGDDDLLIFRVLRSECPWIKT